MKKEKEGDLTRKEWIKEKDLVKENNDEKMMTKEKEGGH